jgi:purine catabolism regulator
MTSSLDEVSSLRHSEAMLTLHDVLELAVIRSARPVVLTAASTCERRVRWVHTSEIYDIGPLLQGGELLLTTGLGLVGESPERLRQYVDSLADRGVTGVCLELGRTFDVVPPAMLQRADERGLAVVSLTEVVPFVAITEAVHDLLLGGEVRALRASERLGDRLLRGILDGVGLDALLAEVAGAIGRPVSLVDASGTTVASTAGLSTDTPTAADIVIRGRVWGGLCSSAADAESSALLDRAAGILAVYLARPDAAVGSRAIARRVLVRALLAAEFVDSWSVREAAVRLSVNPSAGRDVVACAVQLSRAEPAGSVVPVEEAARREFGAAAAGDLTDAVLVIVPCLPSSSMHLPLHAGAAGPQVALEVGRRLAQVMAATVARRGGASVRAIVVGEPRADLEGLRADVADVRACVALLPRTRIPVDASGRAAAAVLRSRDLALERLIAEGLTRTELTRFVDGQLSAVLEHDARHRRGLLPTLEAYLELGGNKVATATALGVQRQTLYDRLARLEELLGVDLGEPVARTGLHLAIVARRLRTGAMGFSPPAR